MKTLTLESEYSRLPAHTHAQLSPIPVANPAVFALNDRLGAELGIDPEWLHSDEALAVLSGNQVLAGSTPLAQAYAGHQFGGWVPQLGDGRAILLGELRALDGQLLDVQLKGSGRTPFSRGGDGRAALGPVIREFLVSEAMDALGIPTTRALAAITTGEPVLRETVLPGAILTRIASSHLRVGTFQYFAARQDVDALQALADFAIERHYPEAETALDLLTSVVERQAQLIAAWMSVGFIHGVMNTDNMAISGETIDYGPCAFMDEYHPGRVFSSIDQHGRYAFANQPNVAVWNLAQLASSLLPLMGEEAQAIDDATAVINRFGDHFRANWLARFGAKIGLADPQEDDAALVEALLTKMAEEDADFTITFRQLTEGQKPVWLTDWAVDWQARLSSQSADPVALMRGANPVIIARNHRVEEAIQAALAGDPAPFQAFCSALRKPFADDDETAPYRAGPTERNRVTRTFCGT